MYLKELENGNGKCKTFTCDNCSRVDFVSLHSRVIIEWEPLPDYNFELCGGSCVYDLLETFLLTKWLLDKFRSEIETDAFNKYESGKFLNVAKQFRRIYMNHGNGVVSEKYFKDEYYSPDFFDEVKHTLKVLEII